MPHSKYTIGWVIELVSVGLSHMADGILVKWTADWARGLFEGRKVL